MAQTILLKRSALQGKVPDTGSLQLGEVAINTYDGKAYIKRSGSIESIQEFILTNTLNTGSINLSGSQSITGSLNVSNGVTGNLFGTASFAVSASYAPNLSTSSYALSSSYAQTSSYADNFTVAGTLTAQTIVAQVITSSTEYITGSTIFGSSLTDTHQFTGSVTITGSLAVNGVDYISTSASIDSRILANSSSIGVLSSSFLNTSASLSASISQLSGSFLASSASFDSRILANSSSIGVLSSSFLSTSASLDSRILANSSSIGVLSSSFLNTSSSLDQRVLANSSSIGILSSSYLNSSASFDTRILNNSSSIGALSSSYLNSSASFNSRILANSSSIGALSSSFLNFSSSYSTGSFSGSFTGSFRGDGSAVTGVISASYAYNADFLDGKNSSEFAITGSNTFIGKETISGSIRLAVSTDPDPTGIENTTYLFASSSNTLSGQDLYIRQNGNLTKYKWLEGQLASGLLYGGIVTWSGSVVYISSGSGIIVDYNATTGSEISPTVDYVTWGPITSSITNVTSSQVTYLYIDNNGSLIQQQTPFTPQQYEEYIPLGTVGHFDFANVSAFGGLISTAYGQQIQTNTFIDAFGPLKLNGYLLTPQTSTLHLNVGSGTSFIHGGFYTQNQNNPSTLTSNSQITASIVRCYTSGSNTVFDTNTGSFYTTVNPTKWDNNGVLDTVNASNWSIQRIFSYPPTNTLYVYYGQSEYTTFTNALQYLASDPFIEGLATQPLTTFVGYLILKGNTTNLADTANNRIIQAGLYRSTVGGSTGGSASTINLEDLADVTITSPVTGEALIYNAGIWVNNYPTTASYANNATSASYAFAATSASYALNALTASYAISASQATSASYAISASQALTASYAFAATSASYAFAATSASYALSASHAPSALTASYAISASQAITASYANDATSASYAFNATSASYAAVSTSGSYAATSSFANDFTVAGTLTAQTIVVQTITSSVSYVTGSTIFGSQLSNTHQFTGSVTITGSLAVNGSNAILTNQTSSMTVLSSSYALTSSFAQTASYVSSNFQYEVHVSQVDGNDTTGNGDLLNPVASITKALTLTTAQRKVIVLHPGGYTENPTVSSGNITIQTTELTGGNTVLYGTLTIPTSGSGARISGFSMDNLAITETAQAYVSNCTVNNNVVKSSSGYVEIINSELQCISGIQISGAGITIINGNKNVGIAVSNASAQVIIKGCNSVVTPSASAGNLAIVDCIVTALGGNGITITGASTTLTLANSQVLVQAGNNVAPISVAGIYSIINTIYDKPGSTITGTSTNSVDYFQYINADNITTKGLTVTGSINVSGSVINNLTSSFAVSASQAATASYALNVPLTASYAVSASYAITASYAFTATSSSYAFNATSASYATTSSLTTNIVGVANRILFNSATNTTTTSNNLTWEDSVNLMTLGDATGTAGTINKIALYTSSFGGYGFGISPAQLDYVSDGSHVFYKKGTTPTELVRIADNGNVTISGSLNVINSITGNLTGTASYASQALSASYAFNATSASHAPNAISASYAQTSSYANNFTVAGTLTATTLIVQTVSSSVVYSSGSNIFGNNLSNTQEFTGSVAITGSLSVNNSNVILTNQTSSMTVLSSSYALTASYFLTGSVTSASYADSASYALSASFTQNASNAVTSSYSDNLVVKSTLTFASTLDKYATVNSSISGTNNLFSQITGSYTSAFFKYVIKNSTNSRAGEVMVVWDSSNTEYTDISTNDIGNTSAVTMSAAVVGSDIQFNAITNTSGWNIKSLATFM